MGMSAVVVVVVL